MIQILVEYEINRIHKITITGHANSGPKGQDLVCASVSSIATGALNAIDQIARDHAELVLREKPDSLIQIQVKQDSQQLQDLLRMLVIQLKTLEIAQLNYIQIKEVYV